MGCESACFHPKHINIQGHSGAFSKTHRPTHELWFNKLGPWVGCQLSQVSQLTFSPWQTCKAKPLFWCNAMAFRFVMAVYFYILRSRNITGWKRGETLITRVSMGRFHLVKAGWRWWGQLVCEWAPVAGRPFSCSPNHFTEMCKKTPWHLGLNGSLQQAHTGYFWIHHKKTPGKLIRSSIKSVKTVKASSMQVRNSDFTFVTDDVIWLMTQYYDSCRFKILKIG